VNLLSINADPNKNNGVTFKDYYQMWQTRQELLSDKEKLKAFDADERTRDAKFGNMTQRQFVLLKQYYETPLEKRPAFLEKNGSEIDINRYKEWLKDHPKENGHLAALGQEKVLTKEAYDVAMGLLKPLDIPDVAVEHYLPPKDIADNYFKFQDEAEKRGSQSWEVQLMLAKDNKLREWLGHKPIDTPVASLELKVKNHADLDKYASFSFPISLDRFVSLLSNRVS